MFSVHQKLINQNTTANTTHHTSPPGSAETISALAASPLGGTAKWCHSVMGTSNLVATLKRRHSVVHVNGFAAEKRHYSKKKKKNNQFHHGL